MAEQKFEGGGILILIHKSITFQYLSDLEIRCAPGESICLSTDIRWLKVSHKTFSLLDGHPDGPRNGTPNVLIGCVYLHPNSTAPQLLPVLRSFEAALHYGNHAHNLPVLLGGDYNARFPSLVDYFDYTPNPAGELFEEFEPQNNLTLLNSFFSPNSNGVPLPTYPNSQAPLDLVYVNDSSIIEFFYVASQSDFFDFYPTSDHFAISCCVKSFRHSNISQQRNKYQYERFVWDFDGASEEDWKQFSEAVDFDISHLDFFDGIRNPIGHSLPRHPSGMLTLRNSLASRSNQSRINDTSPLPHIQLIVDTLWSFFHKTIISQAELHIGKKLLRPGHKAWYSDPHIVSLLKEKRKVQTVFVKARSKFRSWKDKLQMVLA